MQKREIERAARDVLGQIWGGRTVLAGMANPDPISLLRPEFAAELLGLEYLEVEALPSFRGVDFEAAGVLDRGDRRIAVATRFGYEISRFTGAHELGHWLLHPNQEVLHRDRPIKGLAPENYKRSTQEREADTFAAFFLMPRKLVEREFALRFGEDWPFQFDENVAFWLGAGDQADLLRPRPGQKTRALTLATARRYQGQHFTSLAEAFGVSPLSMAIHLEDLGFVSDVV